MKTATQQRTRTPRANTLTGMTLTNGNIYLPFAQPGIGIESGRLCLPSQIGTRIATLLASSIGTTVNMPVATVKRRGRPAGSTNKAKSRTAGGSS